ncbi:DUF3493 domain-containing protein [Trichothermofontia sichuanensis B231]|uniref:DUF3493 domain-containing protein n=1 Tax=Trichothermofontia sichuanensis TaxID=3045816 RepID=UPI0022472E42|nr:DUF3493 domain-containing protein [Trichothermofontia sichuanensis]UZQ56227.1 DUF3493 domain-containing protein [Trichothermofontia sichuanensis B231]
MPESQPVQPPPDRCEPPVASRPTHLTAEQYARLKAEVAAPYRGLRLFIYLAFAASGTIGAFIFLTQLLAGHDVTNLLPNLVLQLGVVALMLWLFRLENRTRRDR